MNEDGEQSSVDEPHQPESSATSSEGVLNCNSNIRSDQIVLQIGGNYYMVVNGQNAVANGTNGEVVASNEGGNVDNVSESQIEGQNGSENVDLNGDSVDGNDDYQMESFNEDESVADEGQVEDQTTDEDENQSEDVVELDQSQAANPEGSNNNAEGNRQVAVADKDEENVCISPESILSYYAHQNTTKPITKGAVQLLSTDVTNQIRNVVVSATQFMKHSYRTRMSSADINRAMQELNFGLVVGHQHAKPMTEEDVIEKYTLMPNEDFFIENDTKVDLIAESKRILSERKSSSLSSSSSNEFKELCTFKLNWSHSIPTRPQSPSILSNLEEYYDLVADLLLNLRTSKFDYYSNQEKKKIFEMIYADLAQNPCIKLLLARLVAFFYRTNASLKDFVVPLNEDIENAYLCKFEVYRTMLSTITAVFKNPNIDTLSFEFSLFETLLHTLVSMCFNSELELCAFVEPFVPPTQANNYLRLYFQLFEIRSTAAMLISQLMFKYCLPFSDVQLKSVELIENTVRKSLSKRHQMNLFGRNMFDASVMVVHRYLGFDICLRHLYPMLRTMFPQYEQLVHEEVVVTSNLKCYERSSTNLVMGELCLVGELILKGLNLFLCQQHDDIVLIEKSNEIYSNFCNLFGDTLSGRLAPVINYPQLNAVRKDWCTNMRNILLEESQRKRKRLTKDQPNPSSANKVSKMETDHSAKVQTPKPKKKACSLLESMLFAETSLSTFTESLLEQSHRQYARVLPPKLYEEDLPPNYQSDRVIFEGKRVVVSFTNLERQSPASKQYAESQWHKHSLLIFATKRARTRKTKQTSDFNLFCTC